MARPRRIWKQAVIVPALTFAVGFFIGWAVIEDIAPPASLATDSGVRISGQYKLVSPLLLCSTTENESSSPFVALQNKLEAIISSAKQQGQATDVSVYFRDSGNWLGINDNDQYAPASLLKVPIMIAYLKERENDPSRLTQNLTLSYNSSTDENTAETFHSPLDLPPGSYSVDTLIKAMVEYSDNNAATTLYNNMDKQWLSEVYTDLGLSVQPGNTATAENITAKQYSYFFRILYNATYLTPQDSEKALEYLAASDFPQGLRNTVPAGTTVASKFGERTVLTPQGTVVQRELHDCGLIYAAKSPYLLCIMTQGKDFTQLTKIIDEIGVDVYQQVNS